MADEQNKPRPGLIPPHGGYRELKSYQNAEIVYDGTVKFCDRFGDRCSRTHGQMVQAAETYRTYIEDAPPEVAANTLICLFNQTNYLLDQQLRQLEQQFLEEGGLTEKLYRARSQARKSRG